MQQPPPNARGRIALLDDDPELLAVLDKSLTRRGFSVTTQAEPEPFLAALDDDPDVVVTDLNMPTVSGIEVCRRALDRKPGIPVIVLTAFGSLDTAVAAIRAGAYDFLSKPVDVETLALVLDRAVQHRRLTDELKRLRASVANVRPVEDMIGESRAVRQMFSLVERTARADTNVLVRGETGTGKELVARALHARSPRREAPFVAVNCAAIPESLLESELFGHTRGAFTDAHAARAGLFVRADQGTLFLDEIGDLPPSLQSKLLRVLQDGRVRPVGADEEVTVDVRVVCATHADLDRLVRQGDFRSDLMYRLDVIRIEVPPLRERENDVLLLAQSFLEDCARRMGRAVRSIAPGAARRMLEYAWPGNVRELQNCIERAVALTEYEAITVEDLPPRMQGTADTAVSIVGPDPYALPTLEEMERRYLAHVLGVAKGNKSVAARILGLHRKTLYRMLEQHGLVADEPEPDA